MRNLSKMSMLGYSVFLRTYARTKKDGYLETRDESLKRVIYNCNKQLNCNFEKKSDNL